jgi:hypothetical protein
MNFLASSSLFTANGMEHHVPKFMGQCIAQSICRRVYLDKEQHRKFPEIIPTEGISTFSQRLGGLSPGAFSFQ